MDTVRCANSGHTGGPLSSLDFTYILYKEFLKFDPNDSKWFDRDRFILSAGHESALLYSMLTLVGWLDVEDLKQFRQLGSKTPGHPEHGLTPGVEATTGPLGQGVANSVGMALAESMLSAHLGSDVANHYTYVLHGDGDIQEPVAQGAIALAGHWGLNKLIAYYDANDCQISGNVNRSESTDYKKMYESHKWQVIEIDGHSHDQIRSAIRQAHMEIDRPTVIIGHTVMAKGTATMEKDHNTHGAPLPHEEIKRTKNKYGLNPEIEFYLPNEVLEDFRAGFNSLSGEVKAWNKRLEERKKDSNFQKKWDILSQNCNDFSWPSFDVGEKIATRKVWGSVIESLAKQEFFLVGGSADLEPSNVTEGFASLVQDYSKENPKGKNLAYGVREFSMAAINNGIALHSGMRCFDATFFVFADYMRPALRLRALQELPAVSEFTHDSFYVGEDGPTHQPIEHLMSYRSIPNMMVLRPADANEAVVACKIAFEQTKTPSMVLLTRQGLPVLDRTIYPSAENFRKGGYILSDSNNNPDIVIIATGSEVSLAMEVKDLVKDYKIRIVNLGCWELFDQQTNQYKNDVLGPESCLRVSIEAGITDGWQKYTGLSGLNIGINQYGISAPANRIADYFGFNADKIAKKIITFAQNLHVNRT